MTESWKVEMKSESNRIKNVTNRMILRDMGFTHGKTFRTKDEAVRYANNYIQVSRIPVIVRGEN